MEIVQVLKKAVDEEASDIHLSVGVPPVIRVDGELFALRFPVCSRENIIDMLYSVLNDRDKAVFEEHWELDTSLHIQNVGRFRLNLHRQKGNVEAALRIVNENILSPEQLGISKKLVELAHKPGGLILITGPTGSGKTTTLASLIDTINREKRVLIITIEDPIEYLHHHRRGLIKQREIGQDTKHFSEALKRALRQDPDVLCIGEMRDLETISTALTAAETGHLVMATLHTPDVLQTIDRIIDVFPPHQQNQIRIQLANSLLAISSQKLFPILGKKGRVLATELLVANPAVRRIIRAEKTEQIFTLLQTSNSEGMYSFDQNIIKLFEDGLISLSQAMMHLKFTDSLKNIHPGES